MNSSTLCHIATAPKPKSRPFAANVENWRLGDSSLTGATRMAVLMVSEQKHSSGGNWGMAVAAVQNTQLSRQIGEQLLRAICLTSRIVDAGEKGNGTAVPADSHQRLSRRRGDVRLCPCLTSKGSKMMAAGDVAQQYPKCWTVCSLPAKGYPMLVPRAGEVSWACFSKHQA